VATAPPNKPRRRGLFGQVDPADEACHERELCTPEEREQLKNITTMLQYIGGISAVGILNPPGGLDQNGHVRFRHHVSYFVYFRCAEFAHDKPRWRVYLTVNVTRDATRIRKM
ncbi:unnamed protein product, partial [Arabidopsis halleri]